MKNIPGTISTPNTLEGWTSLFRSVSSMSQETCEKILDANGWAHNAMVKLEYRREMSALCKSKGVDPFTW